MGQTGSGLRSEHVYERLLAMNLTSWSERLLQMRLEDKQADQQARASANVGQVFNTKPSHDLSDYVGDYENPAYGILQIGLKNNALQLDFHTMRFPLTHFHYDRFDTPDDEQEGKFSINFRTNPQGDIDQAIMRTPQFSDETFEFIIKDGQIQAMKQKDPSGEYTYPKK